MNIKHIYPWWWHQYLQAKTLPSSHAQHCLATTHVLHISRASHSAYKQRCNIMSFTLGWIKSLFNLIIILSGDKAILMHISKFLLLYCWLLQPAQQYSITREKQIKKPSNRGNSLQICTAHLNYSTDFEELVPQPIRCMMKPTRRNHLTTKMIDVAVCGLAIVYLIGSLLQHSRHSRNGCIVHSFQSFTVSTNIWINDECSILI